ncbi:MAG: transcriptional repressor [Bryobacteraceae bacterium]|nr:transcriptional repressor [Bryobacteraceae bacterium]
MSEQTAMVERRMEAFRERCRERGLALTHQRLVIYRVLAGMEHHPSPEALYEMVKKEIPSISLGTVYKNIHTFLDNGLLREVTLHHGTLRLETKLDPHHHLVCSRCKTIVDLEESDLEPVRLKKRLPKGFRVERFRVEAVGLCAACAVAHKSES